MSKRKNIRRALVAAKKYLSKAGNAGLDLSKTGGSTKTPYICYAIGKAFHNGAIELEEYEAARKMIENRIYPFLNVYYWLEWNVDSDTVRQASAKDIQQYRHRWLDAMIKEFSK